MAKLYFRYGAMGSSKTANALMVAFNYKERGQKALILKPDMEDRDGKYSIRSRIGLENRCTLTSEFFAQYAEKESVDEDCIIVDEAQFLSPAEVETLTSIADKHNIPVICYGLRTDFQGHLFPGSQRLLELADTIEEIKTVCWCGRKATFNARYNENGIIRSGDQIELGGNDRYVALCRKHYMEGALHGPNAYIVTYEHLGSGEQFQQACDTEEAAEQFVDSLPEHYCEISITAKAKTK